MEAKVMDAYSYRCWKLTFTDDGSLTRQVIEGLQITFIEPTFTGDFVCRLSHKSTEPCRDVPANMFLCPSDCRQ